jgi:phage tail sheath gpL-like
MSEPMTCISCGAALAATAKFCGTCGTLVEAQEVAGSETPEGDPEMPGLVAAADGDADPTDQDTLAAVGTVQRKGYKNFVSTAHRADNDGFTILSKSFLSTQKRSQAFTDDTVGDLSRSRVVSDKLPAFDPLPPVGNVVSRKKPPASVSVG